MTDLQILETIFEALLSRAIVEGVTAVADGQYRLSLADRTAWLYQNDCLIHHAPLDADMLGEQTRAFMSRVGF